MVVAFGSAVRPGVAAPGGLDVAVRFERSGADMLGVLDALAGLAGTSRLDLLNLNEASPVARERALVGGVVLAEHVKGAFAIAQMAAVTQRMDTAWWRRWDLELMAR